MWAGGWVDAGSGAGLSLSSGSVVPVWGLLVVLLGLVPVLLFGLLLSALGNRLSGPFVVGSVLLIAAWSTGPTGASGQSPMDGLIRLDPSSGGMMGLVVESVVEWVPWWGYLSRW